MSKSKPLPTLYVVPMRSFSKSHRFEKFAPWTRTVSVFSEPNPTISVAFSRCLVCGVRVHTLRDRAEVYVEIAVPRSSAKTSLMSNGDSLSCDELVVRTVMER